MRTWAPPAREVLMFESVSQVVFLYGGFLVPVLGAILIDRRARRGRR